MESLQNMPGSEFLNQSNLNPVLQTIAPQATVQNNFGQQNLDFGNTANTAELNASGTTESGQPIWDNLGMSSASVGMPSVPLDLSSAPLDLSSATLGMSNPTSQPTASQVPFPAASANLYGLGTGSGNINCMSPPQGQLAGNALMLGSSRALLPPRTYTGAYGAGPNLAFVTPRSSVSPRLRIPGTPRVLSRGYGHSLSSRPAPMTSNPANFGFNGDVNFAQNSFTPINPTRASTSTRGTARAAMMTRASKKRRSGPAMSSGAQTTSGIMDGTPVLVKQEIASTPGLTSASPAINTIANRAPAGASLQSQQQTAQDRICSALPLLGTEATPVTAPTTLPGEPKHRHFPLSILIDYGCFPDVPDHLLKACKDILERALTDPNPTLVPRVKNDVPRRVPYSIPAGASAEVRQLLKDKNKAAEKDRNREANRLSAERKRFREHQHRDLSSQKIAELEPERNFWMAVAVSLGADEDL